MCKTPRPGSGPTFVVVIVVFFFCFSRLPATNWNRTKLNSSKLDSHTQIMQLEVDLLFQSDLNLASMFCTCTRKKKVFLCISCSSSHHVDTFFFVFFFYFSLLRISAIDDLRLNCPAWELAWMCRTPRPVQARLSRTHERVNRLLTTLSGCVSPTLRNFI